MRRVFIFHGWDGYPEEGWFPWLKKELESRGFEVVVPQLPHPEEPRIEPWVSKVRETVGIPDKDTYLIGHSMGCQAIIRFLEKLPEGVDIGGAVFVAGFLKQLTNLESDELVGDVVREWLSAPIDLKKVKSHLEKSIAIFSDNDPYVPVDNKAEFEEELGSKIIIEHGKGHFSGSTGTVECPPALRAVLTLSE
jgi:predicted alpha/beta hydrolase family esterase